MQCNSGVYPNIGQGPYFPFNPSPAAQQCGSYPEMIGEGEIAPVVFPGGRVQYYFMPNTNTNRCVNNASNVNQYNNQLWNTNCGAWYVRGIVNTISQPTAFSQHCQPAPIPFPRPHTYSDCNINVPALTAPYQLKFHNDNWSSTTDLHYFYPSLRRCDWFNKVSTMSTSVQVELLPTKITHRFACSRTCPCAFDQEGKRDTEREYKCDESSMSVEEPIAVRNDAEEHSQKTPKRRIVICECHSAPAKDTTNKSVTTYEEHATATGCNMEKGRAKCRCDDSSSEMDERLPRKKEKKRDKKYKSHRIELSRMASCHSCNNLRCDCDTN